MPDDAAFPWDTPAPSRARATGTPPSSPEAAAPPAEEAPAPEPTPRPGSEEAAPPAPVPDSHLLVPRDAWDKILAQLGNLHDAGQQLAEARERAAKAETEAVFLRERLAEMRERLEPPPPEPEPAPPPAPEPAPPQSESVTARLTRVWRLLRGS